MGKKADHPLVNREISWLSFNHRVLQEAMDPSVPLFERLTFLAIFSSNLDEFFRVRVASLRSLLRLKKKTIDKLGFNPARLLRQIHKIVTAQQERFGEILRGDLLPELARHGVVLVDEQEVDEVQGAFLRAYFEEHVRGRLDPVRLDDGEAPPFLKNRHLYLVTELWPLDEDGGATAIEPTYALVEVPSPPLPRFVALPEREGVHPVMFLDDVVRYNLPTLYDRYEVGASYALKLSRDADLYLDDEYEGSVVEKIRKSLSKRETGVPCRFLYDLHAPHLLVSYLKQVVDLQDEDLVLGGRYHNLHDFFAFPRFGLDHLANVPMPPLAHPSLEGAPSLRAVVAEKDRLLSFPYQSYRYVVDFLEEAAGDPDVEEVWITLYRVASDSGVVRALIRAAEAGKRVTAFVEVQARFDEESNLRWAERMEEAGVRTLYSMPGLKVHAKLFLVGRREGEGLRYYAYLGTGNFNEKTARVYTDHALLTADPRLTADVRQVFAFLSGETEEPVFEHLFVAPFRLRKDFYRLIDAERERAEAGRPSGMILKMNALEDEKIIRHVYDAARAGVPVDLIVRGICCLAPGVEGVGEGIRARSIVDRFLEHARIYLFHNEGEERLYLSSADWMQRNLSRRVEVAFPILDPDLHAELRTVLDLQLADDTKARVLDAQQENAYVPRSAGPPVRAQVDTYRLLQQQLDR